MRFLSGFSVFCFTLAGSVLWGQDSQTVTLNHKLQIPGKTLKPGEYTFTVEDRLEDRAIIRITNAKNKDHELILAVPSGKLTPSEHGKLIFFPTATAEPDRQILQGWMCSTCQSALEVVYPKADAVKITGESAKPVMAVDPTYDKLPKNLSPDDMKVVTLWLLTPQEITPDGKGKGVQPAKYADVRKAQGTQTADAAPPLAAGNPSPSDAETKSAMDRATAPPPPGAVATTNHVAAPSSSPTDASSSAAAAAPVKAPPPAEAPVLAEQPTPAVPTEDAKPAAVAKLNPAPTQTASVRRMPHTAGNTYTLGLIGFVLLLAGAALRVQRRVFSPVSKTGK